MAVQAGQAYIQVVPSLRGWQSDVRRQLAKELAGVSGKVPIEGDFDGLKREAAKEGADAGGTFAQSFKRRVEAALKALPDVKIGADSSAAQREIAEIRRELQTLSEKTVGIDIDSGEATAKINRLKSRLDRLAAENPSIDLDVDIAAASAQLGQIDRQVDRLDGRRASVHVDVDRDGQAQRSSIFLERQISGLVIAGAGIAPVFVPAFAAAAAAAVGFSAALAGAGAGIGALVAVSLPAFSAVSDAVKATDQAEKAAATSAVNTTKQRVQAAFQAQQAARRVSDAQQSADRTSVEGAKRVADAQRALGDARREVSERIESANEKVADSERQLERAHEAVQRAQEDLTDARREAIRVLEDLREESSDFVLTQEGAEISLARARQRLAETNQDATATLLDRREAAYEVRVAEERLSDVQRDRKRTAEELKAAEKAGINGSDQVLAANDRLTDANETLGDAQRGVAEAQRDLARAQSDGARTIAEAEGRVSEARTEAAQANADAARAVGDALEAQAQQAAMAAMEAQNGVAAHRNLAYALGELSPMQMALYDGWIRLRDAFQQWAQSLEPAVIPLFLQGMGLIERLLPMLSPLVIASADAFGYLLDQAEAALGSPFWKSFFDFLARVAGPAIAGFGDILGNLARGFGGILMAFEPMSMDLTNGLIDLTERFADWGEGLADNPAFRRFVEYVQTVWPPLRETLGSIVDAFVAITEAMAPLGGGPVLSIIRGVADAIAGMDPTTIQAIALAIGAMALALKAVAFIGAVAALGPVALAIALVAGAVAIAWVKFEGFREAVRAVVNWFQEEAVPRLEALGRAIVRVFEEHIRPALETFWAWFQADLVPVLQDIGDVILEVFREIVDWFERNWPRIQDVLVAYVNYLKWAWDTIVFPYLNLLWNILANVVGPVLLWLWHEVAEPAIKAIAAVISWAWQNVISPIFAAIAWTIETILGPVFSWLWNEVIVPVWNGISTAISWAWNLIIKPIFDAIWWVISGVLAPVFRWLWHEVIEPVWNGIQGAIETAWNFIRDNIFEPIRAFLRDKLGGAFTTVGDVIIGAFETVRDTIGGIWDRIVGFMRTGANLAIDIVNGLIRGLNAVVGWIPGVGEIPTVPHLRAPRAAPRQRTGAQEHQAQRESGGLVPMPAVDLATFGPFVTQGARAIVGEGNPRHPEFVIPTDPRFRDRALGLFSQLGTQLLARGGQIGRPKGPGIAGLYNPLAAAVAKIINAGRGSVSVVSGWRSYASQASLYHKYLGGRGNLAAKPGTSRHEAGAAVDLGGDRGLYTRLARGMGLVAPVRGEPWHWEHPSQSGIGGALGAAAGIIASRLSEQFKPYANAAKFKTLGMYPTPTRPAMGRRIEQLEGEMRTLDTFFNNLNTMFGDMGLGGSSSANRALGKQIAAGRGWHVGGLWDSLDRLVMSESGWRNTAQNPTSSAYGIGQFLDSTWASVGMRKTSDPGAQIKGMLQYIAQRYGNPIAAWSFKRRNNWYETGGVLPSYGNGTLRVPHDQLAFVHRDEAVLNPSDAEMFRQATLNAAAGGKGWGGLENHQHFHGITDPVQQARATGDELAWRTLVG